MGRHKALMRWRWVYSGMPSATVAGPIKNVSHSTPARYCAYGVLVASSTATTKPHRRKHGHQQRVKIAALVQPYRQQIRTHGQHQPMQITMQPVLPQRAHALGSAA